MRLHALTLTAFGPFAGTESVDFDRLNDAGLFLLTGPTGAGKTSILDGICFALYGTVPGARQAARALRSDHAPPGVAAAVCLELTVRGRRLRVTRSPAWERHKRRGSGTTTEHAKVLVEELSGGAWVTVSTRLDEAGGFLATQLGLSAAQFCQVVLLPQGQFADFLRADADRRRNLLETLFDTRRFADVETWLVNRRQETGRALAAVDSELETLTARAAEVLAGEHPGRAEPAPEDHDPVDAGELCADLRRRHAETQSECDTAGAALAEATTRAATSRAVLDEGRRVHALVSRAATLTARLTELRAKEPWLAEVEVEIEAARSVEPIRLLAEELVLAESELSAAEALARGVQQPVATVLAATGTCGASPVSSRVAAGAARETRDTVAALRDVVDDELEADRLGAEATRLEADAVELAARRGALGSWLEAAAATRSALVQHRAGAQAASTRLALASAEQERCQRRVQAARHRDRVAAARDAAREALWQATDRHQEARDTSQNLRERRLAGMAGELARALRPDEPCAVCGSTAHPSPAAAVADVSAAAEEEAARVQTTAEEQRRAAEQRVHEIEVELAGHRTDAGGDEPVDALESRLARATRAAALDGEAAGELAEVEERLAAFDVEREAALREHVALDEQRRAMEAAAAELGRRTTLLRDRVAAARGTDATVADRIRRLSELAEHLESLGVVLSRVEHLTESRDRTQRRLLSALHERGLGSSDEVRRHARTPEAVQHLESAAEACRSELRSVEEQLAEPALVEALVAPAPELSLLERAAEADDEARVRAATRHAQLAGRAAALARLAALGVEITQRREPLAAEHVVADRLARLAEGKSSDNALRMSLSSYVLAARLEQVALAATERLLRMTSGRYALRHVASPSTGKGRGGLSLRVVDAWTGQERDPGSLSGGETFTASLSLALGLADVVAAEAGGVLLETLFVDEGFGSLDDDTLDDVMSVLDDLREGGRAVGVVSHVADLRQRIPAQVRLVKARTGSAIGH